MPLSLNLGLNGPKVLGLVCPSEVLGRVRDNKGPYGRTDERSRLVQIDGHQTPALGGSQAH